MSSSYGLTLQTALFARLSADAALGAVASVHDAPPDTLPLGATYVLVGEEDARHARGPSLIEHRITVEVVSPADGFATAKAAAQAVAEALATPPALARGRIVSLRLSREQARRGRGAERRRIIMTFQALIEADHI
ncbi:MAG: DUF3168 domain-containing protein [Pseudomonadota bacterium]